jgi:hypothetical protein
MRICISSHISFDPPFVLRDPQNSVVADYGDLFERGSETTTSTMPITLNTAPSRILSFRNFAPPIDTSQVKYELCIHLSIFDPDPDSYDFEEGSEFEALAAGFVEDIRDLEFLLRDCGDNRWLFYSETRGEYFVWDRAAYGPPRLYRAGKNWVDAIEVFNGEYRGISRTRREKPIAPILRGKRMRKVEWSKSKYRASGGGVRQFSCAPEVFLKDQKRDIDRLREAFPNWWDRLPFYQKEYMYFSSQECK